MIISLSGRIGSGKDSVARIILHLKNLDRYLWDWRCGKYPSGWTWKKAMSVNPPESEVQIKKFAFKLKQIVSILTGIPAEDFERQEVKDSVLPKEWDWLFDADLHRSSVHPEMIGREKKYTVRELLQRVGTEAMRNRIHTNVWVNALFSEYKCICGNCRSEECNQLPNWIITDTRFPNEAQAVKERDGFLVRINRTSSNNPGNHPSETALDNYEGFDYVLDNNGTIEELVENVKEMMKYYESIKAK